MPLIKLQTAVSVPAEKRQMLLVSLSRIMAETIGKPEKYVMAVLEDAHIAMSGEIGGAACVDIRSIGGLSPKINEEISRELCAFLKETLGISPDRVFINFTEVAGSNWGWNGETFG